MSGPSRANVPKYNLSAMLQQVGSQGAGAARDGAWGQRTAPQQGYEEGVFSASKPLRALPQSAATVEAKRRQRSVEPARPAAAPSTPAELQVWVTVFGADWSRIGSVKATLSERFGAIVDCKIPTKESNAGHYKFDSSQAALMAVQVHSFTVAGTEVHTAPCTDESVLAEGGDFLEIDAKCTPRAVPTYTAPVVLPNGPAAIVRELLSIGAYPLKYLRMVIVVVMCLYILCAMWGHVTRLFSPEVVEVVEEVAEKMAEAAHNLTSEAAEHLEHAADLVNATIEESEDIANTLQDTLDSIEPPAGN